MSSRPGSARQSSNAHCLAPGRKIDAPVHTGQYCRMFPDLPALVIDADQLHALGAVGAACDTGAAGAGEATVAAGWPSFGQLVAHDITADRAPLTHAADAEVQNFRTPRLNLECLYSGGPVGSPYLFDRDDPSKFLIGEAGCDVPRNSQGIALIGDPRNDVHLFVNQLHLALLKAHNAIVDRLRADGVDDGAVFDEARTCLVWHYQWVVLHDFLPGLVGEDLISELCDMAPSERIAKKPSIPFEFADAAYRYGHAQIRQTYRINADSGDLTMFPDLIGFRPVGPDRVVDWSYLFDVPGRPPAQRSERIDGRMPRALLELPHEITGDVEDPSYRSLASRDLQRGLATGLPSGEAIARRLGLEPLSADDVGLPNWRGETPLWYYIAREADVIGNGDRLGPVGGRIVAEVFLAITDGDATSYRSADPQWRPVLPASAERAEDFGLVDLLYLSD